MWCLCPYFIGENFDIKSRGYGASSKDTAANEGTDKACVRGEKIGKEGIVVVLRERTH